MTDKSLIEKMQMLKEVVYYVNGQPNLAPFSDKVNFVIDQCIAIVAMGDAKAVNSSTEQAQSGIAPEAAGLEPECAQPSPASDVITHEAKDGAKCPSVFSSEISDDNIMPTLLAWAKRHSLASVITNGEAIELANDLSPYLRTPEPDEREAYNTMHVNWLRHGGTEEGRTMFEKYLRYRAAGHSHARAEELMEKPYAE